MRRRRKQRRKENEYSFWQSYSDMMAALLLIFILVMSLSLVQSQNNYNSLKTTQGELDQKEGALLDLETQLNDKELALIAAQEKIGELETEVDAKQVLVALLQDEVDTKAQALADSLSEQEQTQLLLNAAQKLADEKESELDAQATVLALAEKKAQDNEDELTTVQTQLEQLVGVKAEIIDNLSKTFAAQGITVNIDQNTGDITFDANVLFASGNYDLTDTGKTSLEKVLSAYFEVLLSDQTYPNVAEIIIEGHTDSEGDYLYNLQLSQERALAVATYCLDSSNNLVPDADMEKLRTVLTANGKSYSDPIYAENGTDIDKDKSRRVEIKFRLKDDEMIEQIRTMLEGQ